MARFEPFRGTTYDPGRVRPDDVVAPPYDVVSPAERASLAARSPFNAIHVELPVAAPGDDPYEHAARLFESWHRDGIVLVRAEPAYYVYRMTFQSEDGSVRSTIGVLGALAIDPDQVLPHEQTTPKDKHDRLSLLRAARTNFSPIWALSTARGLAEAAAAAVGDAVPFVARDDEGVLHESWAMAGTEETERITALVASTPVLIADGHHRYETASTFHDEEPQLASAGSVLALVVELADDQLAVRAIHRLLSGVNAESLPGDLERWFEVEAVAETDPARLDELMRASGALGLMTRAGSWLLRPAGRSGDGLDSRLLANALSALGIDGVTYQHGLLLAKAAVDEGRAEAAVLLRPVSVEQIARTARGEDRMPPKSTFFHPKLRTGMVYRELEPGLDLA